LKRYFPITVVCAFLLFSSFSAWAQVKMSKEQILFYTSGWKGERFPDGRPKIPDELIQRSLNVTLEDLWDYLSGLGYHCQYDNGWQALHIDKPMAGRALTAQYMPSRPDMASAIKAE
jgi:4-hydroxy-4-methyl-2-oxoglutarate aldolase